MVNEARAGSAGDQSGFSLLELTVALVVTLIVSGAVFGLMIGGKSAFRREPELSDRQQQIRIAMSLIERDVLMGGQDMGRWFQVFSRGLNGAGQTADAALQGVITAGQGVDFLEVRGNDGLCPPLSICGGNNGIAGVELRTITTRPACMNIPGLAVVTNRNTGAATVIWACEAGSGSTSSCKTGNDGPGGGNGHVNFQAGNAPNGCDPANPNQGCNNNGNSRMTNTCGASSDACDVSTIQVARYEIRRDAAGVPDLWRSPTGGLASGASGNCAVSGVAGLNDWQLLAKGIEDMQVLYKTGNPNPALGSGGWWNEPEVVVTDAPNTVVREVRVTLSARSLAPMLTGQTTSAQGASVRGQVTRTITPRSAMVVLQDTGQWR